MPDIFAAPLKIWVWRELQVQVHPTSVLGVQSRLWGTEDAPAWSSWAVVLLWKASHPHSSQQCSASHVLVTAGLEFWLCCVSVTLGTIACAAWQWRCPSVPTLCGLPSQSLGSLAPSITISLLAGKNLVLVVVSVGGACVRVVTSRDLAAWQALRREVRDFSRGRHQNWGCGKACARSLDSPADLPQHWWSDHNTVHELWTAWSYSAGCEKKEKIIRKHLKLIGRLSGEQI